MPNKQPKNLWEYYATRGQQLPSVEQRRTQFNLGSEYRGTAQQNTELLGRLQGGQIPSMRTAQVPTPQVSSYSITRQPNVSNINPQDFVPGTPEELKPIIQQASQQYGISTGILSALLKQESGFNPRAVSPVGAQGIAQFMPATAKSYGVDPWEPTSAVHGAARYLSEGLKEFGDIDKALAAYNAGPGAVRQYGGIPPFPETQRFVQSIRSMISQPEVLGAQRLEEPNVQGSARRLLVNR